jgi:hyperosmotically inducible periplasmic protein
MRRAMTLMMMAVLLGAIPAPARADAKDPWITMKTKLALLTSDGVSAMDLNVDTVDGVVTLHGKVTTSAEKSKAESVARTIEGVKQVKNLLQVVPEASRKAVTVRDEDIKRQVERTFEADKAVTESGIKVASVNKGLVLLSGTTDSLAAHLRAVELALAIDGVKRVSSEVVVRKTS